MYEFLSKLFINIVLSFGSIVGLENQTVLNLKNRQTDSFKPSKGLLIPCSLLHQGYLTQTENLQLKEKLLFMKGFCYNNHSVPIYVYKICICMYMSREDTSLKETAIHNYRLKRYKIQLTAIFFEPQDHHSIGFSYGYFTLF